MTTVPYDRAPHSIDRSVLRPSQTGTKQGLETLFLIRVDVSMLKMKNVFPPENPCLFPSVHYWDFLELCGHWTCFRCIPGHKVYYRAKLFDIWDQLVHSTTFNMEWPNKYKIFLLKSNFVSSLERMISGFKLLLATFLATKPEDHNHWKLWQGQIWLVWISAK